MSAPDALRVAYLVNRYPALSLGFVEREIEGLRRLGAQVEVFTIRPPVPAELLTTTMREEAERTPVLLQPRGELVRSTLRLLRRRPAAYARLLRLAATCGPPRLRGRVWQVFYLTEAVRLHQEMSRLGLRHLHVHFATNGADVARLVVALGRELEGPDAGWRWTLTMHGPTELEEVEGFDLVAKVLDAHTVACISDFTRSQMMRLLPVEHWPKLRIVRMSADVDRFALAHRARPEGRRPKVLYVGRLVPEKGAPVLLEATALLRDRGVDVDLEVAGIGPLAEPLARQVGELGLEDRVSLLGGVGQDDLPRLYAEADVFCLPSFQEGLPVVLMEALSTGLPVVTTRIAGIPELVDDSNGRVVSPGRADLLADALQELLVDPALRERLGQAGRARVEADYDAAAAAHSQLDFLRAAHHGRDGER